MPKPEKKAAAPAPEPTPAPAAPAPSTEPEKVSLSADELFDFDKAVLKPAGKQSLDDLVAKLNGVKYDTIVAIGYADRLGSDSYNKKLSLRRAEAVKAYLVKEKGISADKVFVDGKGEANPVTGDSCKGNKKTKSLIECLQPDRRVEVEVAGTRATVQ
jgi:OOP family OmpA-OmpF porin